MNNLSSAPFFLDQFLDQCKKRIPNWDSEIEKKFIEIAESKGKITIHKENHRRLINNPSEILNEIGLVKTRAKV